MIDRGDREMVQVESNSAKGREDSPSGATKWADLDATERDVILAIRRLERAGFEDRRCSVVVAEVNSHRSEKRPTSTIRRALAHLRRIGLVRDDDHPNDEYGRAAVWSTTPASRKLVHRRFRQVQQAMGVAHVLRAVGRRVRASDRDAKAAIHEFAQYLVETDGD